MSNDVADSVASSDFEAEISARLGLARAAWPELALDAERFARWLGERARDGELPAREHSADLYLACACAEGNPVALAAFEQRVVVEARQAVARIDAAPAFVDDALQALREKLFVGSSERPPRIAEYAGRASLAHWLVAAAVRTALNLRRNAADRGHDALSSSLPGATIEPELRYLKANYKTAFEGAVRAALGTLAARDRALLQLHYFERLGVDRLAALYRVGRSTAHRWLSGAREALFDATRAELAARLGLSESEFAGVAALVVSDLELSLHGLLAGG